MEEGKIELPAEEVFVLLKVSTNLESRSKWQEKYETNDDENESLFTFDDDDDVQVKLNKLHLIYLILTQNVINKFFFETNIHIIF